MQRKYILQEQLKLIKKELGLEVIERERGDVIREREGGGILSCMYYYRKMTRKLLWRSFVRSCHP